MEYDPHIINVELMAGQAYTASADYFNALHRLEKGQLYAQDMFAPLTEHPRIAECLLCLGILNIDLGEYVTAQRFVIHWSNNYIENNLIWPSHPFFSCKLLIFLSYCAT